MIVYIIRRKSSYYIILDVEEFNRTFNKLMSKLNISNAVISRRRGIG
jgi:DNA-binding HxlR family transcriptional regulator